MVLKALRLSQNMIIDITNKAEQEKRSFSSMIRILIQKGLDAK
mgnify:CR=1|jgi:hypothetical protein